MATEKPWHRRHAIQLAAKLPESKSDALLTLQAATRLVELPGFSGGAEPEKKLVVTIVRIGGDKCD